MQKVNKNKMSSHKFRSGSANDKAHKFFVEEDSNKQKCQIEGCTSVISTTNGSNMVSHLKYCHPEIYKEHIGDKLIKNQEYYSIQRLELIQNCVEIVTVNGRPFKCLGDSGFRKIVDQQLTELANHGFVINLDNKNFPEIKNYLRNVATKIRELIKQEVEKQHVSLMADIVTKNSRSILGLSIQFPVGEKIEIRTINMIQLKKSNTGSYLKSVITECMSQYDIKISHLSSITTDNGKNMVAMVEKFSSTEANEDSDIDSDTENDTDADTSESDDDSEIETVTDRCNNEQILHVLDEFDNNELNEILDDPISDEDNNLEVVAEEFVAQEEKLYGIRCASHTLQLCIADALKISNTKGLISLCRNVVAVLRTKKIVYKMRKIGFELRPCTDVPTRWCSTFLMASVSIQNFLYLCLKKRP